MVRSGVVGVLVWAVLAGSCFTEAGEVEPVLDTSGFWRVHYTLKLPVIRKENRLEPMLTTLRGRRAKWVEYDTPLPPADWSGADFDDGRWHRMAGVLVAGTARGTDRKSPYMALVCMRGKFQVTDPVRAKGMTLSLAYRGGAVVYLNGKEIARQHLAKPRLDKPAVAQSFDLLAESTRPGEEGSRKLTDIPIPTDLLRPGTNVLAIEVHRAAYRESEVNYQLKQWPHAVRLARATCGVEAVRLSAPKAAIGAVVPNVARPKGLQVWNSNPLAPDFDLDYGDTNEPLRPVHIVGTPGGTFSGKVVVGSTEPLTGLHAVMSDLRQTKGAERIPASAVQVRYALPDGGEAGANARYLAAADRFDVLAEVPPAEVPVRVKKQLKRRNESLNLESTGLSPVFGAVLPVWVTVRVPADAKPGEYEGELTIRLKGGTLKAPVRLTLCGWKLPAGRDFRTWVEIVQSPETLAMEYDVPLWSDRHVALVERSLELLGEVGNKTVYLPLICDTNMGNAESMVRWIEKPDGSYAFDFRAMERYLDLVEKHQGRPEVVCLYLWESFLPHSGRMQKWEQPGTFAAQKAYQGRGVQVTLLDPASGKVTKMELPTYTDPKCKAFLQPLVKEVLSRLRKRGYDEEIALGLASDWWPDKPTADFLQEMFPGMPWVSHSHNYPSNIHGAPIRYKSHVYSTNRFRDPSIARMYGWKVSGRLAQFPRLLRNHFPVATFRLIAEMQVARNYRGFSRMGGDFWPVLKDARGRKVGGLSARFPKSAWWGLNIGTSLLAPGKHGPVATTRFEMLREGIQECEARIFIERALTDKTLRAKLGDELARRCQTVLDERTRSIRRGVSTFIQSGHYSQHAIWFDGWWQAPGVLGAQWYIGSGWQDRSQDLYTAAADVAAKL